MNSAVFICCAGQMSRVRGEAAGRGLLELLPVASAENPGAVRDPGVEHCMQRVSSV